MLDLDFPVKENPNLKPYLHWLMINIPGESFKTQSNLENAQEIMKYKGPNPHDSEEHRYVFLVYQQSSRIERVVEMDQADVFRYGITFKFRERVEEWNLEGPVAGNIFFGKEE